MGLLCSETRIPCYCDKITSNIALPRVKMGPSELLLMRGCIALIPMCTAD